MDRHPSPHSHEDRMQLRPAALLATSTVGALLAIGIALALMERRTIHARAASWWARGCA